MKVYTPEEVAAMLKVSKITVYRHIKQGLLRASKIGQQYRISEEQLKDYFDGNEEKVKEK
ncbi:helix-turn-helix domain-containing protein [Bacillus sp. BA3]|uniref:helix-turn-helix domain-containing protein n=1 Tax=Bacillus sp. BA3 TaxID=2057910 RepID=UPI0012FF53FA|nr:helix-turn-helix domain-containing protein [Bacillus sp. BA3]